VTLQTLPQVLTAIATALLALFAAATAALASAAEVAADGLTSAVSAILAAITQLLLAQGRRTGGFMRDLTSYVLSGSAGRDSKDKFVVLGSDLLLHVLTGAAGALLSRRHAHLRQAWAADMYNPESAELLPVPQRLRLAAGHIVAAARCHLDDTAELAWRTVDALVSSWHGSNLAMLLPVTVAVGLILPREGFYGLITNAENVAVIAAAPYAAIKGLRRYRQTDTPKRPQKKTAKNASSAAGSERPRE
jgi:hypothetical protein